MMIRPGRSLRAVAAIVVAMLAGVSMAKAESASAIEVRAAFVYNFAKFTEWPADAMAANAPIVVCVIDEGNAANVFRDLVKGRTVGPHGLAVRRMELRDDLKSCHLVWAPELDEARALQLLTAVDGQPILTISDFDRFAMLGGVANFIEESGHMRFVINVEVAQRARLTVSSQLLSVARLVKSTHPRR